jgi:hypothetical protein
MDTSFGVHDFAKMPQKHSVPLLRISAKALTLADKSQVG